MRIRWVHASRVPRPPLAAVLLVAAWALLVVAASLLEAITHREPVTCLLRWVTGHPCPTCGSTRLVLHLAHGRILQAFLVNPLVFLGLVTAGMALGIRMILARRPCMELSRRARALALAAGCVLLIANWVWVLRQA